MSKKVLKALPELEEAGILTPETVAKIIEYYDTREKQPSNRLIIIFGILGSLLVGLGLLLIFAHNWDQFPRPVKVGIAFLPLVIGQLIGGYALQKQKESVGWLEGSATFIALAIGICMALISQIYQIPGKLSSFVLTWVLLGLPLVYVFRASFTGILYLIGITFYACDTGYFEDYTRETPLYWGLLVLILPHYYWLYKRHTDSNFFLLYNWLIPGSLTIALGTLSYQHGELMFWAYFSLLGIFYLIGHFQVFQKLRASYNGYQIIGSLGMIILLLITSFSWFWKEVPINDYAATWWKAPEAWLAMALTGLGVGLLWMGNQKNNKEGIRLMDYTFLAFALIYVLGIYVKGIPMVLSNLLLFIIAVDTIRRGARTNHLGTLNYGLLIMTALILCRFFDGRFTFIIRGLAFLVLGLGFFLANNWMLRRRKKQSE